MAQARGSGRSRPSGAGKSVALTQFMLIELKQRVLAALNKLADRDTQHIAVEELEHIAESLSAEGLSVCLSCLCDTADPRQKSGVTKERLKMLGTLAILHGNLLTPHLPKIVANAVRRLRDSDSSVRDACVETMGTLASKVAPPALPVGAYGGGTENGVAAPFAGPLGVFLKPLFDALNEQNRGVQVGAAMCLARVIESAQNAHPATLQRLCPRIVKYLNSPTFSAKAALLSVIASIAQAGGAASHQCLAMLVLCVQEALKSTDWATRKAASETFASMACSIGSSLASFKDSALDALESCRFDKVKPVRDSIVVTLQVWKDIPTTEMAVPAKMPSVKENTFTEGHGCHLQASNVNFGREEATVLQSLASVNSSNRQLENHCVFGQARSAGNKISGSIHKKRTPLIDKKGNPGFFRKIENKDSDNWQVEVAVPFIPVSVKQEDSLESDLLSGPQSATFARERNTFQDSNGFRSTSMNGDVVNLHERNESVKQPEPVDGHQSASIMIQNQIFEETVGRHCVNGRRSRPKLTKVESQLDSVMQQHGECGSGCLTADSSATTPRNCTVGKVASGNCDLALIHRQLCQIEEQQSNLLKLLQEFASSSQESLHGLDARVRGMENVVDNLARDIASVKCEGGPPRCCGKLLAGADYLSSKFWKRNERGGTCNDRSVPSKAATTVRSVQASSVTVGAETCDEHRYGAAAWTGFTGGQCLETEANTWRVHVDVSSKNTQRRANSDFGAGFPSIKKGCDRTKGHSRLAEGLSASSVRQASKDEATLAAIRVTGGNTGVKVTESVKMSGGLSHSSSDTWTEQNLKTGGPGKGLFWTVWTRTVEFLKSGDVDSAYIEVLCAGDELLLVRLMSRTGPVLEQLSSGTAMELLGTVIQLLLQQSFLDIIIPWIQQVADLAGSSVPECLGLSLDARREMVASLREASALEFLEPWVGKTLDELALRLANIWGIAFQKMSIA